MRAARSERSLVVTLTKRMAEEMATFLEGFGIKTVRTYDSVNLS